MTFSRFARWALVACAAVWLGVPSLFAQDTPGRGLPLQIESPISPLPTPVGPILTPAPDPAGCVVATSCEPGAPTPAATFAAFIPSVSESGESAADQAAGPPPDLGTVLNYVAAGVVVVGVTLKIYWFISDRRKGIVK
jgi:hypothetical protein